MSEANRRYGGNTACVVLEVDGHDPIVLDVGTGMRPWGETLSSSDNLRAVVLVTHMHWDHVQGLPFFGPLHSSQVQLDLFGPHQEAGTLAEAFCQLVRPPFFPVKIDEMRCRVNFHEVTDDDVCVSDAKVKTRLVRHRGPTLGFRVDWDGVVVAYIPDLQQPTDGTGDVPEAVLELADNADLLIHDAQYTPTEFAVKGHWGHSTADYAVHVAREAGARTLALFHHDPAHTDAMLDCIVTRAQERVGGRGPQEVLGASEGLTIAYDRP